MPRLHKVMPHGFPQRAVPVCTSVGRFCELPASMCVPCFATLRRHGGFDCEPLPSDCDLRRLSFKMPLEALTHLPATMWSFHVDLKEFFMFKEY